MALTAAAVLARIEPILYGPTGRRACVAVLTLASLALATQAVQVRPDASFEKTLPLQHPYMQVFKQYQQELGGANTILVALVRKDAGTIYEERFLASLRVATDEVFFTAGIDRSRVSSIFTRDVRYIEVVDGGMIAADVIPVQYAPSPEMFDLVRTNVGKAGVIGRLVSRDQRGAMVAAEVLEREPATYRRTDYARVAEDLEDKLRRRFASPTRWVYRLREAHAPFAAGEAIGETFRAPARWQPFRTFTAARTLPDGSEARIEVAARDLAVEAQANPHFNPDIDVHIIGFAKVVGDLADATVGVAGFFLLTVAATMLALWWYVGNLRLALLPLACSLLAVVWEFGLLHVLGHGLDPFAVLVPFLVLAVSTSHGVQYVNTWTDEVVQGRSAFEASRAAFRRLFIPGTVALVTNVAGFLTIYLVPIDAIRDMSLNACLGMFAVIVTNKVLMPVWLSYLQVRDVEAFREKRTRTLHAGDRAWRLLSGVTETPAAAALVGLSLLTLGASAWYQQQRIVGDAQEGVAELRPESVYNRDVRAISRHFAIGTDLLKVIAETQPSGCADFTVLDQLDRFLWRMQNVPGVESAKAFTTIAEQFHSGLWELNPKARVLPRNRSVLAMVNHAIHTNTGLLNGDCSAMPAFVFTADHRATTIRPIIAAVEQFNRDNAREFYEDHAGVDAAYCGRKTALRRGAGTARAALDDRTALLRSQGWRDERIEADGDVRELTARETALRGEHDGLTLACPVHFALASGNIGVMAATNDVVEQNELRTVLWVYAVIAVLLAISYRSLTALLVICLPLFLVSIFANALMAFLGIGLKVATLPVVALAVGIGVDYGIYVYDVLHEHVHGKGLPLREAYFQTLRRTGKAVLFTGLCLAGGVATWLFSDLQFQRDMGLLLVFMFTANMLGAVLLCPAYCRFLMRAPRGGL